MKKRILILSLTIITAIILILACAFVLVGCKGWRYEDENFVYSIFLNHAKVKEVKNKDATELVIPSSISYKNRTCTVDEIGAWAFTLCRKLESVTIPDTVTRIGKSAFSGCDELTSIHIPDSVTRMYGYVFEGCTSLQSVTMSNNVTYIGWGTFWDCTALVSITIPDSVRYLYGDVFFNCKSLQSVTIGNNVGSIGKKAFFGCESLTSIVIPDSVTEISREAFKDCSSLKSVTIGKNVKKISYDAFYNCYRLVEVYNKSSLDIVKGSVDYGYVGFYAKDIYKEKYQSRITTTEDGYVFYTTGDTKSLIQYIGSETDLTLPYGITEINDYAFYYCNSLTNVTIPDSVTSIGEYAFYGCTGLTRMIIPDSVTTMGSSVFGNNTTIYCEAESMPSGWNRRWNTSNSSVVWGYVLIDNCFYKVKDGNAVFGWHTNKNITNFEIPSTVIHKGKEYSVTSIDDEAFYHYIFLASITIPESITSIGHNSFLGCYRLVEVCNKTSLNIVKGSKDYGYVGFYAKDIFDADHQSRISITEDGYIVYTVGDTKSLVGYIGSETNLTLPYGITEINKYAFRDYISLKSVAIPNSVTTIGEFAFYDCTSLQTVYIPYSVTSIGDWAFVFYNDITIYCEAERKPSGWSMDWNNGDCPVVWGCVRIDNCIYKFKNGNAVFVVYIDKAVMNFEIPSTVIYKDKEYSVTSVGDKAFAGCIYLVSITIPERESISDLHPTISC